MTPKHRSEGLLVEHVDDEVVVYDRKRDEAHRLNETLSDVWLEIDGEQTVEQIAEALEVDVSVIELAVDELTESQLLETGEPLSVSRRAAVRRAAAAAGIGLLLPALTSIAAPTPAAAMSGDSKPDPDRRRRRRRRRRNRG